MDENLFRLFTEMDDAPRTRERDVLRAPMGYAGGKSRSLDSILPLLPIRHGYGEPFGGSASVLIARKKSMLEVFNDRYAGVVAFYRAIRDKTKCEQLIERINLTLHSREEFVWCKETWESCQDDVERAARWYYMNQVSFSNKGRAFGRSTYGDPQVGRKLKNNLRFFEPLHQRFCEVQIENQDWRNTFKDYDHPDFVWYVDPTYLGVSSGIYEHVMSAEDHREMCDRIFHLKGFVALSGYDNPVTRDLYDRYPWDSFHSWEVHQSMQGCSYSDTNNMQGREGTIDRVKAQECLWVKESTG